MPVDNNDIDDNDVWHDDESMASTDFSSHAEDSDYEFLTRTSSQAGTEEDLGEDETDSGEDELPSIYTTTQSAASVTSLPACTTPPEDEVLADSVLQSTELPHVVPRVPENPPMDDSTATVIHDSHTERPRQGPVIATSLSAPAPEPIASKGLPFTILWSGSTTMKSLILRKIAQALMTALLRERETSSSTTTDWSSGYTSVVPITEFSPLSHTAPEVEFVEDSLVKLRIRKLDSVHTMPTMRYTRFTVQVDDKSQMITCHHARGHKNVRNICSWAEMGDEIPSLIVYCSPSRGETFDGNEYRIQLFAKVHRIPILIISDVDIHRFWPRSQEFFSSEEIVPSARFFKFDSLQLGTALWKNAKESKEAIKALEQKSQEFKTNCHKRTFLRIMFIILFVGALLFFRMTLRSASPPPVAQPSYPLANTPTQKELKTKFLPSSELMSIVPSTVTVTEQFTVTVPITETKTVTTSSKSTAGNKRPTSTIVLQAITSTISVPKASLKPRFADVDYGYAFAVDDNIVQFFLETERSVLLRLPKVYRDYPASRPRVRISVTRANKPVDFELRIWKKNDLAFITWAEADMHDHLDLRVWTEANPVLAEHVVIDYTEPIIDPRLWELLSKSQDVAVKRLFKLGEQWDAKVRAMAKDVKDCVSSPAAYSAMEEKLAESLEQMKKYHRVAQQAASRHAEEVKTFVSDFWAANQPVLENEWSRLSDLREKYMKVARRRATEIAENAKRAFEMTKEGKAKKQPTKHWRRLGKGGCTNCGKGSRRRIV